MKTIYFIFVVIFTTLFSCTKTLESLCPCGKVEINKKEYIAMCIIPNIISENSVNKLIIENYTKKGLVYDPPFSIEYFNGNQWETLEFDFGFTLPAYTLHAGKLIEWEINLYSLVERYNDGKKGKYRYVKNVCRYNLYAEFEIK